MPRLNEGQVVEYEEVSNPKATGRRLARVSSLWRQSKLE
jgi:cold shock CspA family protein